MCKGVSWEKQKKTLFFLEVENVMNWILAKPFALSSLSPVTFTLAFNSHLSPQILSLLPTEQNLNTILIKKVG